MQEERNTDNLEEKNIDMIKNGDTNDNLEQATFTEEEILGSVVIAEEYDAEEELFSKSLQQQVNEELDKQEFSINLSRKKRAYKIKKRILVTFGIILAIILLFSIWLVGTKSGRKIIYKVAGSFIYNNLEKEVDAEVQAVIKPHEDNTKVTKDPLSGEKIEDIPEVVVEPRHEDYVSNYLIFGIEEFEGAKNTDSIMIVSVNTSDNTIKLTSLLRDTYIEIPGDKAYKLNAIYGSGGTSKLLNAIEQNYRVRIDGYAHINFNSFEKVINRLGGISIKLGEEEAKYLNKTNYISNPIYRKVSPGMNLLNGNQALGYCRVRRVATLGGANDDYGRTLRQRRVLSAIFEKYKSQSIFNLLSITNDCLGYVTTNITANQIERILGDVVENKITTMDSCRIPANDMFETPKQHNGIRDPLILDWEANIIELYQFIFLDTEEEARDILAAH